MEETSILVPEKIQRNPIAMGSRGIQIQTLEELYRFARAAATTDFAPKDFRNNPEKLMIAMEYSLEIGVPMLVGLQNITVINGRPSMFGDLMLAMVEASGLMDDFFEDFEGNPYEPSYRAVCISKRKGRSRPTVTYFSVQDAMDAKLWGKDGPWKQYPQRMLKFRARGFNLRDTFPDVLRGMISAEEAMDMPVDVPALPSVAFSASEHSALPSRVVVIERPSADQVKELLSQVQAAGFAKEMVMNELKRFFEIADEVRLTQKRLVEVLTLEDYQRAFEYYSALLKAYIEKDITDAEPTEDPQSDATPSEPLPYQEEEERAAPDLWAKVIYATQAEVDDLYHYALQVSPDAMSKAEALFKAYAGLLPVEKIEAFKAKYRQEE